MTARSASLWRNLALCVLYGLVTFAGVTYRERAVEDKQFAEAIQSGLVGGVLIFLLSAVFVVVVWRGKTDEE